MFTGFIKRRSFVRQSNVRFLRSSTSTILLPTSHTYNLPSNMATPYGVLIPSTFSGSPTINFSKALVLTVPKSSGAENDLRNCRRGVSGGGGKKKGFDSCSLLFEDLHPEKRHNAQIAVIYPNLLNNTELCILMILISAIFEGQDKQSVSLFDR